MKKIFLILIFAFQYIYCEAAAVSISISGFAFSPASVTVAVNDVITWTNMDNALHSIAFVSVPGGASAVGSGTFGINETFTYTVTVAGDYTYKCGVHSTMTGAFSTGTATPVTKPTLTLHALYPNPCIDYVHIESAQTIKTIDVYSEAGVLLDTRSFSSNKVDLAVSKLEKGIYFLRIESADGLVETRRIVKN